MKGNIIITGFQGFIGIYTTAKLINEGYTIYGVDKDKANKFKFKLLESLIEDKIRLVTHLKTFFNFDLTEHSLKDLELINHDQANKKTIDLVIHYASPVGVKLIQDEPYQTLKDALTINMMIDDYCTRYKIPLIFSSSSEVFGTIDNIFGADTNNDYHIGQNRRGTYAAQKATSELLFSNNLNYASANIRFFNIVGFGQSTEGMVMNTFINNIFKGIPMRIIENSRRTFCAVEDAVEMISEVVQKILTPHGITRNKYSFNIGAPAHIQNELFIKDLAKLIIDTYNAEIVNNKTYENDILDLSNDDNCYITRRKLAKTGLMFNNFTPIETIIKRYLLKVQSFN